MRETMTAAVLTGFGGPEMLQVRDVAAPRPGPGAVLVRVKAAAVNNTDLWTRQGAYGLPGRPDALAGWRGAVAFPRIQGGDVAGEVVATGDGVDGRWTGRRVLVDPAFYDGPGPDANPGRPARQRGRRRVRRPPGRGRRPRARHERVPAVGRGAGLPPGRLRHRDRHARTRPGHRGGRRSW